jgi:hypothetical protein
VLMGAGLSNKHKLKEAQAKRTENQWRPISQVGDIVPPDGFYRQAADSSSMTHYLRGLTIKKDTKVYLYDGSLKANQSAQYAVLDMDVGNRDLQQCADAVMRLRAEYLWKQKRYGEITFNFVSGHEASWTRYSQGFRPSIQGSKVNWVKRASPCRTYACFRKYMDLVFSYCGTASLHRDQPKVAAIHLKPGDFLIQKGSPYGHAVMIMDEVSNAKGEKRYLLAQSYMPAQSIHILKNPSNSKSPWYTLAEDMPIRTPEWIFPENSYRSW